MERSGSYSVSAITSSRVARRNPVALPAHCWQFKLGVAVRIVQLEHNFVTVGNVRREVAVASFDTGGVKVSRTNLTHPTRFG